MKNSLIAKHHNILYFLGIARTLGTHISNSFGEHSQLISYSTQSMLA